ncbi:hypothetical protein HDU77_010899 [Chytriomyces hyalinus]|nr:hypothetical protein HDU77_010899 [Chytriomyces hyalinus]
MPTLQCALVFAPKDASSEEEKVNAVAVPGAKNGVVLSVARDLGTLRNVDAVKNVEMDTGE